MLTEPTERESRAARRRQRRGPNLRPSQRAMFHDLIPALDVRQDIADLAAKGTAPAEIIAAISEKYWIKERFVKAWLRYLGLLLPRYDKIAFRDISQ